MKPVFQTIVDKGNGNCMQAVIASLFNLELYMVPNFIEFRNDTFTKLNDFLDDIGFKFYYMRTEEYDVDLIKEVTYFDRGINGYFFGVIKSRTYQDATHAVVIDKDLNIIHDPNPNQKALKLHPKDVIGLYLTDSHSLRKMGDIGTKQRCRNNKIK